MAIIRRPPSQCCYHQVESVPAAT